LHIDDVALREFIQAVFAVCATDSALAPSSMKSLHGFKVFPVDVSFAKSDLLAGAQSCVQILGVDGRSQSVLAVIRICNCLVKITKLNNEITGPKIS